MTSEERIEKLQAESRRLRHENRHLRRELAEARKEVGRLREYSIAVGKAGTASGLRVEIRQNHGKLDVIATAPGPNEVYLAQLVGTLVGSAHAVAAKAIEHFLAKTLRDVVNDDRVPAELRDKARQALKDAGMEEARDAG